MRERLIIWAACMASVGVLAHDLPAPPPANWLPPGQTPVFSSRTDLVTLDVTVLDKNRQPVRGLTAGDFILKEDGKPQQVSVLQEIDLDDPPPSPVGWMRDVAPDVTTNTIGESRLVVIVVDDAMIPMDARVMQDTRKILHDVINKLGPSDYTALVYTANGTSAQDFTHDRTALLAAATKFTGGIASYTFGYEAIDGSGEPPVDPDSHYYLSAVKTLRSVADLLINAPQRRKALIWISPGVPMNPAESAPKKIQIVNATSGGGFMSDHDIQELLFTATRDLMRQAQQANVAVYPIDPTGLGFLEEHIFSKISGVLHGRATPDIRAIAHHKATLSFDFVETAAANTGGHAIVNTNDFGPGIDEIFKENSSYYLLGIKPLYPKQDGTFHRVEVAVNRPGVEVHTRTGYYAGSPDDAKDAKKHAKTSPENAILAKALGGVLLESGLPLGVSVAPLAIPGRHTAAVAVVLGIDQPVPAAAATAKLTETTELQISAFTPDGTPRGSQRSTAHVVLRQGATGEATYDVFGRIDLAPGHYALRIAAHNATSAKTGTVTASVVVPDFTNDPFSISGVVVSHTPARASAPKDLFAAVVPIVPSAERAFTRTDQAEAFLRVYQSGAKPIGDVQVAIRIADDHGGIAAAETRTLAIDDFTLIQPPPDTTQAAPIGARGRGTAAVPAEKPDPFANAHQREAPIRYALPLGKLAPGQYLLTIEATLRTTTLRRDVRFTVK